MSNFEVLDSYYNKIMCSCKKCGFTDIYSKLDIESNRATCRMCENVTNPVVVGDKQRDIELRNRENSVKIRVGSHVISSKHLFNLKPGQRFGDLIYKYSISKTKKSGSGLTLLEPHAMMFECPLCKYDLEVSASQKDGREKLEKVKRNAVCPNCSKIKEDAATRIEKYKSNLKSHAKNIEKKQIQRIEPISRVKSAMDKINLEDDSKIAVYVRKFKELNPQMELVDIENNKGTIRLKTVCTTCGVENTIRVLKDIKPTECPGCKELNQNLNYIGTYSKNWVGLSKNNLVVESQNGLRCDIRCKMCKTLQEDVSLYDLINNKLYCNCKYSNYDDIYYCNNCGDSMSIKMSSILGKDDNSKSIICNKCGKESGITYQEIINEQAASDLKTTTCNRLNISMKEYKNSTLTVDNIIKDNESIYIGTDGKEYYRCRCINHNTDMVLSDEEIQLFSHKECYDSRQVLLNRLQSSKLKI